ncbi:MAG: tetratricopeptide repeat protein, partial [Gammaproteobacteria bacterium]
MKPNIINRYFFTVFIILFSSGLLATAESDYELGVASYKAGDNAAAVTYFEAAMKQGMDSVALQYNLASSYYKVGRYEDAKHYFKLLEQTVEMREIANYHLGLIAIKEKDAARARPYFESVVSSGKDEKLVKLSSQHLDALSIKEDRSKSKLAFNLGHDDNISAVSEDSVLGTSDTFYELSASTDVLITGSRKQGWLADAALYGISYSDTDTYDQYVFALGLKRTMRLADW